MFLRRPRNKKEGNIIKGSSWEISQKWKHQNADLEYRATHFNFSTLSTMTKDLCLLESQSELQQLSSMKDSCDQLETKGSFMGTSIRGECPLVSSTVK